MLTALVSKITFAMGLLLKCSNAIVTRFPLVLYSVGLGYYYLNGKGFQRLSIFPGSMIDEFEGHLPCTYGFEVEDFPAAGADNWRIASLG